MSDTNPVHACPHCGTTVLTLPNAAGLRDYEEHPTGDVPAEHRHIWLGSVGVVALPRHWPQPATALSPHNCPAARAPGPSDPGAVDPAPPYLPRDSVESTDAASPRHNAAEPEPADVERTPSPWTRSSLRAQLVELNRLRTQMTLYRAQQTGQLRPHPGQRTYDLVSIPTALADVGRLSPTRCPLCNRPVSEVDSLVVACVGSHPAAPLRCCVPACTIKPTH